MGLIQYQLSLTLVTTTIFCVGIMSQKSEGRQESKEDRETEDDTRFAVASVLSTMSEIFQQLLRNLLLWLLDEEHRPQHLTAVIQEIDEDEGYDSIASKNNSEAEA